MYSYDERLRAVDLYLKLGKRSSAEEAEEGAAGAGRGGKEKARSKDRDPAPDRRQLAGLSLISPAGGLPVSGMLRSC